MDRLTWGFWWLNVVISAYCVLYWARKRYPDGAHALVMPSGQIWLWQLMFSFVVLVTDISPWNLLWLGVVSIVLSIVIARILLYARLNQRIKEQENSSPSNFEAINREFEKRGKSDAASDAATLLDSSMNQSALYSFLGQFPTVAAEFNHRWSTMTRRNSKPSRWEASLMFNQIGVKLAEKGDFYAATTSVACSSLFVKSSPLTWAAQAEIYLAWEDRIAAKWAERVVGFDVVKASSSEVRMHFSGDEGQKRLYALSKRALEIMSICSQREHWRDTLSLIAKTGVSDSYFDL